MGPGVPVRISPLWLPNPSPCLPESTLRLPHQNSSAQSQRPDSGCIFRTALPSTLRSEQVAQHVSGYPRAAWRRRPNRREQAASFHPTGRLYVKPQPCCHKDFGCVKFLVSDQGALPAPLPGPSAEHFLCRKVSQAHCGAMVPSQAPGSAWESSLRRSYQTSASQCPLQRCYPKAITNPAELIISYKQWKAKHILSSGQQQGAKWGAGKGDERKTRTKGRSTQIRRLKGVNTGKWNSYLRLTQSHCLSSIKIMLATEILHRQEPWPTMSFHTTGLIATMPTEPPTGNSWVSHSPFAITTKSEQVRPESFPGVKQL